MKRILILISVISYSIIGFTQTKWRLRECIEYAINHNIEIKQQALAVDSSQIRLDTDKKGRLPDLNVEVGQSFQFGGAPFVQKDMLGASRLSATTVSVYSSVPIFTGFRIGNQIRSSELKLLASVENLKKAKENLELYITSLYLDALFKKEIVRIYNEQFKLTEIQVGRTEVLVNSGKVPESQLYDIKAQLARNELSLISAQNELTLSLLYVAQALNLEDIDNFDIVEPNMEGDVVDQNAHSFSYTPVQIYQIALGVKPHVKEAEYWLASSMKDIKIAESYRLPSLSLAFSASDGYNYLFKRNLRNDGFMDQIQDNRREAIGLTLTIPIFNRGRVQHQVKMANLNKNLRELELDNVKLTLYKEIQEAYSGAMSSKAKYTSTIKAYQAAQESFIYAELRYEVGKLTVFEYNEVQTKLLGSKSEQIQAKYDLLFRAKILDFYRGLSIVID